MPPSRIASPTSSACWGSPEGEFFDNESDTGCGTEDRGDGSGDDTTHEERRKGWLDTLPLNGEAISIRTEVETPDGRFWYEKGYEVDYGDGFFHVAPASAGPGRDGVVAIKHESDLVFRRKAEQLQALRCPYLVPCYAIIDSAPYTDFLFEYMDISLAHVINAPRRPTEQEVLVLVAQLVKGLEALKAAGISDVKLHPARVWINLSGQAKILLPSTSQPSCPEPPRQGCGLHSILQQLLARDTSRGGSSRERDTTTGDLREFAAATLGSSLEDIAKHPFLCRPWAPSDLVLLAHLTLGWRSSSTWRIRRPIGTR